MDPSGHRCRNAVVLAAWVACVSVALVVLFGEHHHVDKAVAEPLHDSLRWPSPRRAPRRTEEASGVGECRSGAIRRVGPALGDIRARLPERGTSSKRVVMCLTGQVRSLPVAYMNWKNGPALELFKTQAASMDFMAVVSLSPSYGIWEPFLLSLEPDPLVKVQGFKFEQRGSSEPAIKEVLTRDGLSVTFNMNVIEFNGDDTMKHGSHLIQGWQMRKCREAILGREFLLGRKYLRVARLRTDVVLEHMFVRRARWHPKAPGMMDLSATLQIPEDPRKTFHAKYMGCLDDAHSPEEGTACVEILETKLGKIREECSAFISEQRHQGKEWTMIYDFFQLGSRNATMQVLDLLNMNSQRHSWDNCINQGRWKEIMSTVKKRMTAEGRSLTIGGPCINSLFNTDMIRLAGPPANSFSLSRDYDYAWFKKTCEGRRDLCDDEYVDMFHLPPDELRDCLHVQRGEGVDIGDDGSGKKMHKILNAGKATDDGFQKLP